MDTVFQKSKFTELRFEYYSTGRALWFSDAMSVGAMLLGYAVELTLKYSLIAAGCENKQLLNSHKMVPLWQECGQIGALPGVSASEALLHYVTYMFNRRYPSQILNTNKEASDRGHSVGQALDDILAYDDLMVQMDDSLRRRYSDDSLSIGILAAHFINRRSGQAFFHSNAAVLRNIAEYRAILEKEYASSEEKMRKEGRSEETIKYNLRLHKERLATWERAPTSIWRSGGFSVHFGDSPHQFTGSKNATNFSHPVLIKFKNK